MLYLHTTLCIKGIMASLFTPKGKETGISSQLRAKKSILRVIQKTSLK